MTKEEMRTYYRTVRRGILHKEEKDSRIFQFVTKEDRIKNADKILLYASIQDEVNTMALLDYFLKQNKQVFLPKCEGKEIHFYLVRSIEELQVGRFHILEPSSHIPIVSDIDSVCLVPGICFSKKGERIGYGGGFYDRFLAHFKGYSIGLTYEDTFLESIPRDPYDKMVDAIITEKGIRLEKK